MGSVAGLLLLLFQLIAILGIATAGGSDDVGAVSAYPPVGSPSTSSSFDREIPATAATGYAPAPLGSGPGGGGGSAGGGGPKPKPDGKPGKPDGNPGKPDGKPGKPDGKPGKPLPKPADGKPGPGSNSGTHGNTPGSAQSPYASSPGADDSGSGFPSPAESPSSTQVAPSSEALPPPPSSAQVLPPPPPTPTTVAAPPPPEVLPPPPTTAAVSPPIPAVPPPADIAKVVIKGNVTCSKCYSARDHHYEKPRHHNNNHHHKSPHKSHNKPQGISGVTVVLSCPETISSTRTNQHGKYKMQFRETTPSGFPSACSIYVRNSTLPQSCNVSTTATSYTPELRSSSGSDLTYSVPPFVFRPEVAHDC